MKKFIITANDYLSRNVIAFFHCDYVGGGRWREPNTIEHLICSFKNDITRASNELLLKCKDQLEAILQEDLPKIVRFSQLNTLTVCVVPRAKTNHTIDQLQFKATVKDVVSGMSCLRDGTDYIIRIIDTRTTHRNKSGYGGVGDMPYPGITIRTCNISPDVKGRDIILIDDLYTKTINIDEDAIEALLRCGARSIIFYSIGRTVMNTNY